MSKNVRLLLCLVGFLTVSLTPTVIAAEGSDVISMELEDILFTPIDKLQVVSASRYEQSVMNAPSAVSVITKNDIQNSAATTIPELLQYVVGMDGYTKTHTDMDVAARGYAYDESSKMLVLVDGQPVNVAPYSGMQWPTLPITLNQIERIEVVRGPASSVYGADALVGVVNIITKTAEDRKTGAQILYGQRGMSSYDAFLSRPLGNGWALSVTGSAPQTRAKGEAENDKAKLFATNWDIKDWSSMYLGSYRVDFNGDKSSFMSEGGMTTDEEGYNPSPGDPEINKSQKRTIFVNNKYTYNLPGNDSVSVRAGMRDLYQKNWKYAGGQYVDKYVIGKGLGVDADVQYTTRKIQNNTIVVGTNLSYLQARRDIYNTPLYVYDESDNLWSLFVQDQISMFDDKLSLTVSGRYDKWQTLDGAFTPKVAANYSLVKDVLNWRVSGGTAFRRPGFDENYYCVTGAWGWFKGAALTDVTGDGRTIQGKLLKPEKLVSYETGLRWMPKENAAISFLDLTFFNQKVSDFIGYTVYETAPQYNFGFSQTGEEVTTNGVELEAKKYFGSRVSTFLNYSYQDAVTSLNGASAPFLGAPKNKVSAGVTLASLVNIDLRARYVSEITYAEDAGKKADGYTTVDLALSKKFLKDQVFVKLGVLNLLDDQHYEYPLYTQIVRQVAFSAQYMF